MVKVIDKPWGHEEIIEHNDHYVVKKLHINAGHRLSLQYHEEKHETLLLIWGEIDLNIGTKEDDLQSILMYPGTHQVIVPGTIHQIAAVVDSIIIECSTTELDDVVRLKDDYGRATRLATGTGSNPVERKP